MGGPGSGRPPSADSFLRKQQDFAPVADDFILPNFSGLQAVKKTDAAVGTGSGIESDPIYSATSGAFLLINGTRAMTGNLNMDGKNIINVSDIKCNFPATESRIRMGSFINTIVLAPGGTDSFNSIFAYSSDSSGDSPIIYPNRNNVGQLGFTNARWNKLWVSGADVLHNIDAGGYVSGAYIYGDGSNLTNIPAGTETDPIFIATSGAFVKTEVDPVYAATSGTFVKMAMSGGWTATDALSGTYIKNGATYSDNFSGSYISGSQLYSGGTVSGSTMMVTGDADSSGAAILRNVLIGTEATPGAASGWTQGTIYLQYTA